MKHKFEDFNGFIKAYTQALKEELEEAVDVLSDRETIKDTQTFSYESGRVNTYKRALFLFNDILSEKAPLEDEA